jgi:hypothetical protein
MFKKLESYLGKDITYKTVRGLDIAYLSVIQFIFAILINIGIDRFTLPNQEKLDEHENIITDFVLLCLMIALLVSLAYLGRRIIRQIPSPFDLISGFEHGKLPELTDITTITSFILLTSGYIEMRITKIRNYFGLNTKFFNIDDKKEDGITITK